MKKSIVLVSAIVLLAVLSVFFYPKKFIAGGGMVPEQYSNVCKGFYVNTFNDVAVDGPVGGLCFGVITKIENPKGPCPQGMNSSNTWCTDLKKNVSKLDVELIRKNVLLCNEEIKPEIDKFNKGYKGGGNSGIAVPMRIFYTCLERKMDVTYDIRKYIEDNSESITPPFLLK